MPFPIFRTKSNEFKRPTPLSYSSREPAEKSTSMLTSPATNFQAQQPRSIFNASYARVLLQSSQDMEDIMRRFQAVVGIDGDGSHKVAPRASEQALSRLPHARILRTHKKQFEQDESTCGVCCERLVDGVALVRLPCGHIYHIHCATSWLSKTCTCPECRYEIETDDVLYERTRALRMKDRRTIRCSCHPSAMHKCFFVDPSKSLFDQLDADFGARIITHQTNLADRIERPSSDNLSECYLPDDADRFFH